MSAIILDGKRVADEELSALKREVSAMNGIKPCIAVVMVGNNPSSETYVKRKQEAAHSIGIASRVERFSSSATETEIISKVYQLGADSSVHGILVQSPLPENVNPLNVFNSILPTKDVDGFNAINIGHLVQNGADKGEAPYPTIGSGLVACTPLGIERLLRYYKIELAGKHVVLIGRSLIVGRPLALLMGARLGANATVTSCNKQTENISSICRTADILISAAGVPGLVKADWVRPGAVVVDVGITRVPDATRKSGFRLAGDVDFDAVSKVASAITPVPGGVGPMTVAMLLRNTVRAAQYFVSP